ncbi:phytanoyl-CoA dioxygenase family protein [Streptomyces rugosispiralis]|uniref:Phytanoyl-CoA dioxygenase family protein n=1 Tax=Streptomyces rugosispiralis TaxID=2967341 RepID=A0ABT1V8N4_9ACTN|nr:phytanoyl-CoA dioxygenase family protein [Streptomyces rugosispiralis]MCQ8193758.1 phytanoyl-CoA dioxygenase family protein [Streptomyces rugosispiralis]
MTAPLPEPADELDTPFEGLSPTATADFNRDGFVHLSDVLSPETIGQYEPTLTSEVLRLNTQHLPLAERDTYGMAFLQVSNLWRENEKVRRLVFSRRLAGIAARLLGVRAVRVYHDQALYKEPSGGQYYWPLSSDRTVTVWLPLQETPLDMGPLAFARGSHNPVGQVPQTELNPVVYDGHYGRVLGSG